MSILSTLSSYKTPLLNYITKNGRAPPVVLNIYPLNDTTALVQRSKFQLTQFLRYHFASSILIPVDAFTFSFTLPQTTGALNSYVQEGDTVELVAGGTTICTGSIDTVDIETTVEGGDVVTIMGRNLLGMLEDQSPVNSGQQIMWANNIPLSTAVGSVIQQTKIRGLIEQQAPAGNFLFATSPGESKLASLLRFVEPLNCLIWGDPDGYLIAGRPDMSQDPSGTITCNRQHRFSNVQSIKAVRSSTQIPNVVLPVWQGQETVQQRLSPQQSVLNPAEGPKSLRLKGYLNPQCIITSIPQGGDPQSLSDVNLIKVGGSNLLQTIALRAMYKANIQELTVQANVKSHYNDDLDPFLIDTVYNVDYQRGGVQEKMYLYQVDYDCDVDMGPRTSLQFCRLGCIVAGITTKTVDTTVLNSGVLAKL